MFKRAIGTAALAIGGVILFKQLNKKQSLTDLASIAESIDVNVPLSTAYNQWTQFEEFPRFMKSVRQIRQLDDKHLSWRATVGGKEKEWTVEITEQTPDTRIAWHSTSGVRNAGVVTFHKIADNKTRVMLQMDYQPEGVAEKIGDQVGTVRMETRANLKSFKELLEQRGTETGAWRGTVSKTEAHQPTPAR
ncbi:MAG TPA: SRPBCC family protein [Spongiibacteraceae bacterium]|nr:SRPBCC family protein [Spongiibacteraceae bacterium]